MRNNTVFVRMNKVNIVSVSKELTGHWVCSVTRCSYTDAKEAIRKIRYRGSPVLARQEYIKICKARQKQGWIDIESPNYLGVLRTDHFSNLLEREDVDDKVIKSNPNYVPLNIPTVEDMLTTEMNRPPLDLQDEEEEVICVDNTLMKDSFTKGVTYIVHKRKSDCIEVYDKYGRIITCAQERFERVRS